MVEPSSAANQSSIYANRHRSALSRKVHKFQNSKIHLRWQFETGQVIEHHTPKSAPEEPLSHSQCSIVKVDIETTAKM